MLITSIVKPGHILYVPHQSQAPIIQWMSGLLSIINNMGIFVNCVVINEDIVIDSPLGIDSKLCNVWAWMF